LVHDSEDGKDDEVDEDRDKVADGYNDDAAMRTKTKTTPAAEKTMQRCNHNDVSESFVGVVGVRVGVELCEWFVAN